MGLRWIGVGVSCNGLKLHQVDCMGLVKLKWVGIGVELELRWSWSGVEVELRWIGVGVDWCALECVEVG